MVTKVMKSVFFTSLIVLVILSMSVSCFANDEEFAEVEEVLFNISCSLGNNMKGSTLGPKEFIGEINLPFIWQSNKKIENLSKVQLLKSDIFDMNFGGFYDNIETIRLLTESYQSDLTYEKVGVDLNSTMYRVNIKKDMLAYAGQDVYKFVFGKVKGKYKLVALISENQFAEFFANFQAAIKQDNYEVISGMMDFPVEGMMDAEGNPISDAKSFKSNKMLEGFKGCFNITYLGTNVDYKPVVKKSSKSNETTSYYFSDTDYEEGYNGATDVVSFTVNIHESSVGEEDFYDFSISHIFGKKNGRYKLIAIMVAG